MNIAFPWHWPLMLALAIQVGLTPNSFANSNEHFFTIGSGQPTGIYYPLARAICDLVNRDRAEHGYRCSVDPTQGSVENVTGLRSRQMDFAIIQSDVLHRSYAGEGRWRGLPQNNLRRILSLYDELATILVREGHVRHREDLLGLRVNVGPPASGGRATFNAVVAALGREQDARATVSEYDVRAGTKLICEDEVDVSVMIVGHPSPLVSEALGFCDLEILSLAPEVIDRIVPSHSYYRRATVPAALYGLSNDTHTFGVTAVLATIEGTPDDLVNLVVTTLLDGLPELEVRFPILHDLDAREMTGEQLIVPLHSASRTVLEERNLLP